jgi:hypothetical protein
VSSLLTNGLRYLFGGARRGQTGLAGVGAAMTIVGWLRRRAAPKRELLWAKNLKNGETVKVRMVRGEVVDVEVGE